MIIFPGLIGSISAAGKTVVASPLNLQIKNTADSTYVDGPVGPYTLTAIDPNFGSSVYFDIRALGTGTETLTLTNTNNFNTGGSFLAFLSTNTIIGGGSSIFLTITYKQIGFSPPDSATITVNGVGDSVVVYVTGNVGGGGGGGGCSPPMNCISCPPGTPGCP